ncbi:hypothetical protein BH18ACT17_BH18ACT17_04320 [soil metagenome]
MDEAFLREMSDGYALDEPSLILGRPMLGGEVAPVCRFSFRCRW